MNTKQLVKVIKTIVEAEVAKKHEQFLTKTFPKILEEEVSRRMKSTPNVVEQTTEVDPFEKAELALQEERTQPKKQFTKNEAINEALNNTKPFTAEQSQACSPAFSVTSVEVQYQQSPFKAIGVPPNLSMMGFICLAAAASNRCSATLGMKSLCPFSWKSIIFIAKGEPLPVSST